jgi:hypothetical protein
MESKTICPKNKTGRHRYTGDFEAGWTCVDCGDFQAFVAYDQTVDHERKQAALERAKGDLKRSIDQVFLDGFRAGLTEALHLVRDEHASAGAQAAAREIEARIEALRV